MPMIFVLKTLLPAIFLSGAWDFGAPSVVHAETRRIASINLCADELLLKLKDRDQLVSVSMLSREPTISNVTSEVQNLPFNRGLVEEVVAAKPDLVLAGQYTAQRTLALIQRVGLPVIVLREPTTLKGVAAHIAGIAQQLGEVERGNAMILAMDRRLAAIPVVDGPKPTAILLKPNGVTAGKGSLIDDILTGAGLRNLAEELGIANFGQVPLEMLLKSQPDFILIDREYSDGFAGNQTRSDEWLSHPAMRALKQTRIVHVPARLWTCAGPANVEAVSLLSEAVQAKLIEDRLQMSKQP